MAYSITFVTTNTGKFEEVKRWLAQLDPAILLEHSNIDLPEYQSLDVQEVALGKAKEAWAILQKPLLIDDGGIYIERYNKFPGTLSKYVFQGIGLEGFWLLAQEDPRAYFLSCLVYCSGPNTFNIFEGICAGTVIKPSGSITHTQLPYTEIFIPYGCSKTFAQLRGSSEEQLYHHRFKALASLVGWLRNT